MTLTAGTLLGPYEIAGLLGAGGMGEVYRALDPRLSRAVAVKLITADGASSPERLHRFETEARAAAQLAHPNVVTVFDVGTHEGHPYLVLELLDGQNLRETLRGGVPPMRQSLTWTLEAARGLGAAHERGIVHRDLKPENIFLTKDGRVKVLDFGLAKLQETLVGSSSDTSSPTATKDTSPGVVLGTVGYMAPEQVKGEPAGPRADVFALGAMLYELLSGQRAFGGGTAAEILASILRDEPSSLMSLRPEIPAPVESVVRRCLGKRPSERFSSGNEVAVALETVLSSLEPSRATGSRVVEPRGPYPGLSSFTEADAERFFGREAEVEALWDKLRQRPLLALIGPSGAGKTSFVRAGLVPSCPSGWKAIVSTPGNAPMRAMAQSLVGELPSDADTTRKLLAFDDPDVAVEMVRKWRQGQLEGLLVLDQFEELFTLNPPERQEQFADLIGRLVREADVHVLLSLRDDFLMGCDGYETLRPVFGELTPLSPLSEDGLHRALTEPAKQEGFEFEDEALVLEMLESVEGARGALPLLAFAVARLWEKREREKKLLTRRAYEQIGGVAGALAQHAEQTLERIGLEKEPIVRELFRNLVTAQWTRAVADREELLSVVPDRESAEQVLDQLIDARLLTSYEVRDADRSVSRASGSHPGHDDSASSPRHSERALPEDRAKNPPGDALRPPSPLAPTHSHRIEIVHESLLRAWPRLVRWQAQDEEGAVLRDQLKQAAHLWEEKGRSPDVLWTGSAFQEFELWRGRYPGKLTAVEDEYAQAMLDRVRRHRRIRRMAIATVVVASLAVAVIIGVSRQEAVRQAERADQAARRAEASKLVALAELRLDEDPTEALALATASLELADTEEARLFAARSLAEAPPAREVATQTNVAHIPQFRPDGQWLVATGHTGTAAAWSQAGQGPVVLPGHEPTSQGPLRSGWPDERHLLTGPPPGLGGKVHVWAWPSGERLRSIDVAAGSRWAAGREGWLLVATLEDEDDPDHQTLLLRRWSLPHGEPQVLGRVTFPITSEERRHLVTTTALEPDGRGWVFVRGPEVYLQAPGVAVQPPPRLLGRFEETVNELGAWRDKVLARDTAGTWRIWSFPPDGPKLEHVIPRPENAPADTNAEPSGRWLFVEDRQVRLWDRMALPGARPLELRRSGTWANAWLDFEPDGDWVVATTHRMARLTFWPLSRWPPSVVGGYEGNRRVLAFSGDSRWLAAAAGFRLGLRLWPVPGTGGQVKTLAEEGAVALAFDPQGRYLVKYPRGMRVIPLDGSAARDLPNASDEGSVNLRIAVSPSGRRVATAFFYGTGERNLRVWDLETGELRLFPLPPTASPHIDPSSQGAVSDLHFTSESTLYTAGDGGLRRWDLDTGSHEVLWAPEPDEHLGMAMSADGRVALTAISEPTAGCHPAGLFNLAAGEHRELPGYGTCVKGWAIDPSGSVIATGDQDGLVRVGRVGGGPPHLLYGHEGPVDAVAISTDLRWVASMGGDHTLRLWPMPDLDEPPLHTLPHDELVARLKSLTNIRAVRDPESPNEWTFELGQFPGWTEMPRW